MITLLLRVRLRLLVAFAAAATSLSVPAAQVFINAIPTNWRLENYPGDTVAAWYTGSSCPSGQLALVGFSANDKNRFFALILSAKIAGSKVIVSYDNTTSACTIVSFGMDAP